MVPTFNNLPSRKKNETPQVTSLTQFRHFPPPFSFAFFRFEKSNKKLSRCYGKLGIWTVVWPIITVQGLDVGSNYISSCVSFLQATFLYEYKNISTFVLGRKYYLHDLLGRRKDKFQNMQEQGRTQE